MGVKRDSEVPIGPASHVIHYRNGGEALDVYRVAVRAVVATIVGVLGEERSPKARRLMMTELAGIYLLLTLVLLTQVRVDRVYDVG